MSKKASVRVSNKTMHDVQFFARPNLEKNNDRNLANLTEYRDDIGDLIQRRDFSAPDATWGSGAADVYRFAKMGVFDTLCCYKPPKMVLYALIQYSKGSKTYYGDFSLQNFGYDWDHVPFGPENCEISEQATHLSYLWIRYFIQEYPNVEFAVNAFRLFIQLYNNEKALHHNLTLGDMINALNYKKYEDDLDEDPLYHDPFFEDPFFYERDWDLGELRSIEFIHESDEADLWWWDIEHRRTANFLLHNVKDMDSNRYQCWYHRGLIDVATFRRFEGSINFNQSLFDQERYLQKKGEKDPRGVLVNRYNQLKDPITTPSYDYHQDISQDSPDWIFLAETYQVSNLWCKKYGIY